jgi:hypothetical protein
MIKQWAAGLSETLALGLINEAIGLGIPLVTVPWVSGPLLRHPVLAASVARLRQAGVRVLEPDPGPEGGEIPRGTGAGRSRLSRGRCLGGGCFRRGGACLRGLFGGAVAYLSNS